VSRIKLTKDQCLLLYLIVRNRIELAMMSSDGSGRSCTDEADGTLDDLEMSGLFDVSDLKGTWLTRPKDANTADLTPGGGE